MRRVTFARDPTSPWTPVHPSTAQRTSVATTPSAPEPCAPAFPVAERTHVAPRVPVATAGAPATPYRSAITTHMWIAPLHQALHELLAACIQAAESRRPPDDYLELIIAQIYLLCHTLPGDATTDDDEARRICSMPLRLSEGASPSTSFVSTGCRWQDVAVAASTAITRTSAVLAAAVLAYRINTPVRGLSDRQKRLIQELIRSLARLLRPLRNV